MGAAPATSREAVRARPGHAVVRRGPLAVRIDTRVLGIAAIVLTLVAALGAWAMTLGNFPMTIGEVVNALTGSGDPRHVYVVWDLRLPRVLAAILVGAALALSGVIFQGLVRNELASPDVIGINAGAAAVGFAWLLLVRETRMLPLVLFAGAMSFALLIYALSWRGGISPDRLILVGVGVQATLVAVETFLVSRFPLEDVIFADTLLLGSVTDAAWDDVALLGIGLAILIPLALVGAWPLRAIQLGDDVARSVGWPLEAVRLVLVAIACWLSALAIMAAGLIAFVALLVPHAARMLGGPVSGSVMVLTVALGALLMLVADVIAQHVLPVPIPVSVVLGAVGAPYFLFLFWRREVRR